MSFFALLLLLQQVGSSVSIDVPRFDETVRIDGIMDEEVWSRASVIDGFRQYEPVDGRPAAERTEVRVWYAPDAIYFGIIAYDSEPQSIRATRADRDNITGDDHVTIYLDTFLDRRRAFFFGVNPLGVQQDGVRTEGASSAGRTFGGSTDRSPDFLFESSGRVTPEGYVVEIRIPFKSLRYPGGDEMSWGINIERKTQRTGFVDTWPDVRRASASFLAQGGTMEGFRDLRRGVVLEAQPFTTVNMRGARLDDRFRRESADPSIGVNGRIGFTNFSLDGTINPDFSQIESDAGQVTTNERFALFLTEKRPFFLEGIELFATPNQLVYTRRIADPVAGAKITGKLGPMSVAYMTALDRHADAQERKALFNVARLRRDVGRNSMVGVTLTDRSVVDAPTFNRVASGDARVVFGGLYYVEGQFGTSWTGNGVETRTSPIWKAELDRTGHAWGFNYQLNGVGDEFETHAGFVNRRNVVSGRAMNRLTYYGAAGAPLERITVFFGPSRIWSHRGFGSDSPLEGSEFVNSTFRFTGEWEVSARVARDFVQLDPASYGQFVTVMPGGGTAPYAPLDRVSGPALELSASTPVYQLFNASASVRSSRVAIFAEGSEGDARSINGSLALRPNSAVRISFGTTYQRIDRALDGSEFARTILPRLRAEFQPTRSFFLRGIAEYRAERRSALRDARTGALLQLAGAPLPNSSVAPFATNGMRFDLLASYQPTPGTVAFLGYGASLHDRDSFAFDQLSRTSDGLFLKLAYQLRR